MTWLIEYILNQSMANFGQISSSIKISFVGRAPKTCFSITVWGFPVERWDCGKSTLSSQWQFLYWQDNIFILNGFPEWTHRTKSISTHWDQMRHICINNLYHHWLKITAHGLFSIKSLSQPVLAYCELNGWGQISLQIEIEYQNFLSRKLFWNVICKMC